MKNAKKKFMLSGACAAMFLLLIVLVRFVDVTKPLPVKESIGLSRINTAFRDLIGYSPTLYTLTEIAGYLAIAAGCLFGLLGLAQLISRKSLLKVDRELLYTGGLYAAVAVLYVFFEKVIINYRPLFMDDKERIPEASFPSSHTMLVLVISGSVILLLNKYFRDGTLKTVLRTLFAVLAVFTAAGRLLSGVHWFTDILGGLLISLSLLFLYSGLVDEIKPASEKTKKK